MSGLDSEMNVTEAVKSFWQKPQQVVYIILAVVLVADEVTAGPLAYNGVGP